MTTIVRRIVSGQKARFKDPILSLELDLVYVTDNIIIMGFPASGVASLYRNSRASVRKFLDHRHEDLYRIYNFCPLTENSYDADYFYGRVSRFPFPDHHVPPLSMIPLFVADMTEWLESDADNVAVIHCKAGKGRSGTMTCCYLISLPYLPSPPQNLRNYSDLKRPKSPPATENVGNGRYWEQSNHVRAPTDRSDFSSTTPSTPLSGQDRETEELAAKLHSVFALHTSRRMKPASQSSPQAPRSKKSTSNFTSSTASYSASQSDLSDSRFGSVSRLRAPGASPAGRSCDALHLLASGQPDNSFAPRASLAQPELGRSRSSFALHQNTEDTTNVKAPKMGVSIPSQRRWVGYWARMLAGKDARLAVAHPYSTPPRRKVRITRITIDRGLSTDVKTSSGLTNRIVPHADSLSIQLARYPDAMVDRLEKWERSARRRNRAFGPHDPSLLACDIDPETQKQKEYLKTLRRNGQNLKCWNGERYQAAKQGRDAVGNWGVNINAEADRARNFEWRDASGESEEGLEYFSLVPEQQRALIDAVEVDDGFDQSLATDQLWRYTFTPQGQDSKGRKQSEASCDSGYSSQSPEQLATLSPSASPLPAAGASSSPRKSFAWARPDVGTSCQHAEQQRPSLSPSKTPSLLRRASSSLLRSVSASSAQLRVEPETMPHPGQTNLEDRKGAATTPPSSTGYIPSDAMMGHGVGQILDADREVMVKVLIGRTGNKHAKLPDFSAAGWVWFIPSFEDPVSSLRNGRPKVGSRSAVRFGRDEIDFRKEPIGVVGIEVEFEWIDVGVADGEESEAEELDLDGDVTPAGKSSQQRRQAVTGRTGSPTALGTAEVQSYFDMVNR